MLARTDMKRGCLGAGQAPPVFGIAALRRGLDRPTPASHVPAHASTQAGQKRSAGDERCAPWFGLKYSILACAHHEIRPFACLSPQMRLPGASARASQVHGWHIDSLNTPHR